VAKVEGDLMKIDISEILNKKIQSKEIDLSITQNSFEVDGESIKFASDVVIKGKLVLQDNVIILNANLKAEIILTCVRCLEEYKSLLNLPILERFTVDKEIYSQINNDNTYQEDDLILLDENKINISRVVEDAIITSLPIQKLCREDCRGLCQTCGTNLNLKSCECKTFDIDPRMDKLKDLFAKN
jgi:uncharacterized protein